MTGAQLRAQFSERMARIGPGAVLASRHMHWTVIAHQRTETTLIITLARGHRTFKARVPLCLSGPELWEAGLRVISPAPTTRDMFGGAT